MSESRQTASARRSERREAAVSLVQGGTPGETGQDGAPEGAAGGPRRPGMHPNTVISLKVFFAVLALGLPLTYLATLDTPGLDGRAPAPPRPVQPTAAGLGMSDFDAEQAAVIARIEALMEEEQFGEALRVVEQNPDLGRLEEIRALRTLARRELARQREAEILEELKRIPVSEFQRNLDRYAELVELNPDEPEYRAKLNFYQDKLREQAKN